LKAKIGANKWITGLSGVITDGEGRLQKEY